MNTQNKSQNFECTLSFFLLLGLTIFTSLSFAQGPAAVGPGARPAPAEIPLNGSTVLTKQGRIQGALVDGVAIFRGIPFAAPPIGDLRWREPAAPKNWIGVRAGNVFGSNCREAEDCLYLNITSPGSATENSKLPVMMYIHGGGFAGGAGTTDGSGFAKQNVILVGINYRLGRAGWFAHPSLTKENPDGLLGNYGLMDQIAALQWIQENIAAFGGDSNKVTIFGGSAGAISVNYLMLAPQARGLFHRAISQSGFGRLEAQPLHTKDNTPSVEDTGVKVAEHFKITGSDADTAQALRAIPFADLNTNIANIGAAGRSLPMADGKLITGSAVEGFTAGKQARVPYMTGGNSDEASLRRRGINAENDLAAIKEGRDEFLAAFDPSNSRDAKRIISRLVSDQTISEPDRALARAHAKTGSPTYVYHFSYIPKAESEVAFGLRHGGETPYVFNIPPTVGFDNEGKMLAESANNYWVSFATTGDPAAAGGVQWPKFDEKDESLMEFPNGGKAKVKKHFHAERLDWVEKNLTGE
ncbi:carboxylesterase/lipase family protein [Aurantivibrio infirmus]